MTRTETLSLERFRALAEAYGGVVARWPESLRGEGMRRAREPAFAQVLDDALLLDEMLDCWTVSPPREELVQAITARAPTRRARRAGGWIWWPGLGLAAALAGASAGVVAATIVTPTAIVSSDLATSFGDIGGQET